MHLAGVHLVDVGTPGGHAQIARERLAGAAVLVNLTRWRQGLVVAPGNPLGIRDIADVLRPDVRFALRESGAGARALLRSLLREVEGDEDSLDGPVASGHGEVARLVRWGVADAGIAIESAAIAEGLDFVPLSEERFDLLLPEARADDVRVARLLELIRKPAFRSEASRLPGYDLSTAGHASTVGAT